MLLPGTAPTDTITPEEFWESVSVAQAIVWVVAIFAAIAFIVKAWPFVRNTFHILDALSTLPKFMESTTDKLESIHHEVNYNNGSSVKDAIVRVESGVKNLKIGQDENKEVVAQILSRVGKVEAFEAEAHERISKIESIASPPYPPGVD